GKPFVGHAIAIIDDDGKQLGDRQVGQILARGPSICAGYFNEPELSAAAFKDGWLYTGDLGYTVDGDVFICGRVKDVIIVRGRNFYPQDIEWAVSELPGVRRGNVVAFGVPVGADGTVAHDAANGEEHLVVCAEAHSSDAAGLVELISTAVTQAVGLATYKVEIVPQGALPRTSSGKPQRRKTRQMFLDGTLPKARGVQSSEGEPAEVVSA
ncbi:MAG: AMP-dependent synthetase, partial [Polyangiaceae bacterium]